MRSIFVFAIFAAAALCATALDLNFETGINLTEVVEKFPFRFSSTQLFSPSALSPAIGKFFTWSSSSVDPDFSDKKASANAMIGLGALPGTLTVPFALLAYGVGESAVDMKSISFANLLISATPTLSAAFETGVMAMGVLNMQEMDADNQAVGKAIALRLPLQSGVEPEEVVGDDGNVTGYTCTFSPKDTTAKVTVTYIASKKAGVLAYGNTPVSPRSFEMIIEVADFPLTKPANHVRLNVALLSAKGVATLNGNAKIVPHIGKNQEDDIYIALSNKTSIDGKNAEVTINIKAATAEIGYVADAVLTAALGKDYDADVAHIDFPAGATSFIYDPALGSGVNVYTAVPTDAPASSTKASSGKTPVVPSPIPASSTTPQPLPLSTSSKSNSASSIALSLLVALISVFVYLF